MPRITFFYRPFQLGRPFVRLGVLAVFASLVSIAAAQNTTPGQTRSAAPVTKGTGTSDSSAMPDTLLVSDSARIALDSSGVALSAAVRDTVIVPDSLWRWPDDARRAPCGGPLETLASCWRTSPSPPAHAGVAIQETGFPGVRATALNLRSFEPARADAFYQPGLSQSPYGTGGHIPFAWRESDVSDGGVTEAWVPVQPLDTPVTDLHWMRGSLLMNQFGITLHRMVGNRAYVAFDYLSNGAERLPYDYAFQVHQPYLGAGRDSLSMVIEDTSHAISSRQIRPRIGFWIDQQTVVEAWADWFTNSTTLAHPTNFVRNDSTQWLYPASFGSTTYGGLFARATNTHIWKLSFRHAGWERTLSPDGDSALLEEATGTIDALDASWTLRNVPGSPRLTVSAENTVQDGALWVEGAGGSSAVNGVSANARGDRETARLDARPRWGSENLGIGFELAGEAARRARPDGVVEMLGSADADGRLTLPWGFALTGGAGYAREGAPEERLFRWQPAQGYFPNPTLTPRTHTRLGAGAGWDSKHIGFGAALEQNRFENTWLPRVLPRADACFLLLDSLNYPNDPDAGCVGPYLADSFALAYTNTASEVRTMFHLTGYLAAGNWKLSVRNTQMRNNTVRDPRLGFVDGNFQLPLNVLKGQLLWRRIVLDGKLGLQTRWDWEWFSSRYAFASEGDGTSRVVLLDEYLALDFTTQMEIKSFLLYFRAMNLYHDRYATEPGVHPPGINFRFGVDWRLRN